MLKIDAKAGNKPKQFSFSCNITTVKKQHYTLLSRILIESKILIDENRSFGQSELASGKRSVRWSIQLVNNEVMVSDKTENMFVKMGIHFGNSIK